MEKLLETYSINDIILILVLAAASIKGIVSFIEWGFGKFRTFSKKTQEEEKKDATLEQLQSTQQLLVKQVNLLIQSDKDDIKSWITDKHHFYCYKQGWIDDYSLECIERRYSHYTEEGGNSFITGFMTELRGLPKSPPPHH